MAEDSGADADRTNVVSLTEVGMEMRFPVLSDLEAYWQTLRGARLVPARSDVDPRRIEDALEYAFILERIAPGMGRFRLAGMHLNDLMGMEVRGMPLTAFFTPEARKRVSAALERVFDEPAIARIDLQAEQGVGREALEARLLLLPLKSDFGDVSRALGCLASIGHVGRPPRRFTVAGEDISPLAGPEHAGDRRIRGWSQPRRPRPVMAEGMAESGDAYTPGPPAPEPPQAPRPPRAEGRPNLYIVSSNDGPAGTPGSDAPTDRRGADSGTERDSDG